MAIPWLPIVLEHPNLLIGPLVVPGRGPCYTCFRLRFLQHSYTADLTEALYEFYQSNPRSGPKGYLPVHASLAAAFACQAVKALQNGLDSWVGEVRVINLLTFSMAKANVIGVHGCERCGTGGDERSRSSVRLAGDLEHILGLPDESEGLG